jgi:hypothetical protein
MKWILFTGTWRLTNKEVEEDVRKAVREVLFNGNGIVTGGATGVDFFAMDECLKLGQEKSLRVIIPTPLSWYIKDYQDNWCQDPVTLDTIQQLENCLHELQRKNPAALLEMPGTTITQEDYNKRHDEEVRYSHEVYAFQVNNSTGTQDTIDKARRAGLPITLHKKYTL